MLIVALTGGIGSGKSLAGKYFAQLGALVVDSDELSRATMERESPGFDEVLLHFGDAILSNGVIDRAKLADIVFSDDLKRKELENIIHPLARRSFEDFVKSAKSGSVVINQIPLLVETAGTERFQYVIAINANEQMRRERLLAKGFSNLEITKRIAAQVTDKERESIADVVITNEGDQDGLFQGVANLYRNVLLPKAEANSAQE